MKNRLFPSPIKYIYRLSTLGMRNYVKCAFSCKHNNPTWRWNYDFAKPKKMVIKWNDATIFGFIPKQNAELSQINRFCWSENDSLFSGITGVVKSQ